MPINLKGRSFLTLKDFSTEEIHFLLNLSTDVKNQKRCGIKGDGMKGKNVVLIFDKASTRTRCAFETGAYDEGAHVTFLSNSHMGHKESIEDTAKVLGRMYDGIQYRGFSHELVEELAKHAGVPVWNGLTDKYHPTQILATFLTLKEKLSHKLLSQMKLVYMGDGRNNMGNSLIIGAAKVGMHITIVAPESLFPHSDLIDEMKKVARYTGGKIECTSDVKHGVKNADAIYTDVWVSMGEEDKFAERIKLLKPYQVNKNVLDLTGNRHVLFMHCLPAYHDLNTEVGKHTYEKFGMKEMEVTDEVFRSKHSTVFDEAENRLHTIKAVMLATIGNI